MKQSSAITANPILPPVDRIEIQPGWTVRFKQPVSARVAKDVRLLIEKAVADKRMGPWIRKPQEFQTPDLKNIVGNIGSIPVCDVDSSSAAALDGEVRADGEVRLFLDWTIDFNRFDVIAHPTWRGTTFGAFPQRKSVMLGKLKERLRPLAPPIMLKAFFANGNTGTIALGYITELNELIREMNGYY